MPKKKTTEGGGQRAIVPSFETAYKRLNEAQRAAVDTIEGPVMCVAGPGTGKTEAVALRVANILRKTHARPGNILCLTFSVSAATAMRERLRALIGSDAYGVTVRNFHGFCSDLIGDYPLVFDAWSALEQISDVERYRQVNKIIDQLLPDLILVNRKQPYSRTKEIIACISSLKREGKTDRKDLLRIADTYEADLTGRSKEGTKAAEKNLLAARKFREFLEVFFRYQQMLVSTQRYDYDDMILYCIRALTEEDWLLAGLQERYQYILVDEFQDTNGAQAQLVSLLTTPRMPEDKPNLFVVGDDDQAIYRFQGANLLNILKFRDRFPSAPVIVLTKSYRCTQGILDAAESLIAVNTERLVGRIEGLDKHLTSAISVEGPSPQLLFAPSDATEAWMVGDIVEDTLRRGIAPEEIAILVQTNAELLMHYDVLTARAIPVETKGKADLLNHPYVRQAVTVMRGVAHPQTTAALSAAISCECFGCHPADIARLNGFAREQEITLQELLLKMDAPIEGLPKLTDSSSVIAARDCILDLHNKLATRTVIDTLEHLLKESHLLERAKGEGKGGKFNASHFAALQEFFDRLKYRAYEQPEFGFESFLNDLEFYENPEYSDLRMSYVLPHLADKGVQLMTAHQSKGLEFTTVILPNFREGHWDKRHHPSGLSLPENLLFGWEKEQKTFERNQDERRVAYVAMTRAKRELIFTCPKELTALDKIRAVSPSGFFAEAGKLPEALRDLKDPTGASLLLHAPLRDFDSEMKAFLCSRLKEYALSVTALNHFLEDPKIFLEIDLLSTPQAKEASLIYGNAVHEALKKWGLKVMAGEGMGVEGFVAAFRSYLETREILTDAERRRLMAHGEENLPRYFKERLDGPLPIVHKVEHVVVTHFEDVPIKGKIDRIDLLSPDSARAVIIDYKTGRPKTEKQIRDEGDYFRQLEFYALLLEEKNSPLKPESYVLDFIGEGTDHPVRRAFQISSSELADLKKIVKAVWAKIMALEFTRL
ncbi:MAG: ATP-dependent DNA helicase [Candidatus Peribacteraceae bacterium]|nr:ATP-dependent DNA helicase [Candidatus Peribacteraceae bacterium]